MMHILEGSIWEKWDLHLHPPYTQLSDNYKSANSVNVLELYCDEIEQSDVLVFGITDYFSIKAYRIFLEAFNKRYPNSKKQFFFNLELRLNETVNSQLEEVNIHLILNPASLPSIDKFLSLLKIIKTGKDGIPLTCADLKTTEDFESATVTREGITNAFHETYGRDTVRQNHFLIFTAANNDGLRPVRGKKRKNEICDEIDKFSDGFLGSSSNPAYYLKEDRLEGEGETIRAKPVITGSDSHSFEDLTSYLGKTVNVEKDIKGAKQIFRKETTWIKADPTYEGLKQILYEPVPGERVCISATKPDQKDEFKVIRKIKFPSSKDFPEEILFNNNLSSIIGSRSSGKSALLAYIAYAVDQNDAKSKIKGPGEGEAFHWNNIKPNSFIVEWANAKTTVETPGKVIYLPQNYLFDKSKEAKEVKARIAPVLFNSDPAFKALYSSTNSTIEELNSSNSDKVDQWFKGAQQKDSLDKDLKDIGDKSSIESEKKTLEEKIKQLKEKNNFNDDDLANFQRVTEELTNSQARIDEITVEQEQSALYNIQGEFFRSVAIATSPLLTNFPKKLREKIQDKLNSESSGILVVINKISADYLKELGTEKITIETQVKETRKENTDLIERYNKNSELQQLIKDLGRQNDALGKISFIEAEKVEVEKSLQQLELDIKTNMTLRLQSISKLRESVEVSKKADVTGIKFGVEYDIDKDDVERLAEKINTRDKSDFVDQGNLKIEKIRNSPEKFIAAVYSKSQKLIQGQSSIDVVKSAFQLTEKILFTADMEGDKIGGFKEPTMTPGKRALFALRLILAESHDQWPLLIDQPEDDLDSRSIFDEIVPFLKQKKKERQIIMVSHNANLVIGADSEQLVIANRNGTDRQNADGKQFNYLTGSLEHTRELDKACTDTLQAQGICEHACSILDGGKTAFENRKNKYNLK